MSTQNRQWILNTRPSGRLTGEEFRWNEAPVPQPSDGQVLVRNLWLSVDPAQRTWMARDSYKPAVPLGDVMQSFAVGQVLESRHPDFKPGDLVRGEFGWQDYAATDGKSFGGMHKLPPGIPPNLALGLFGRNGLTAYFGITEVGQVKVGETVVVSGAAGATGSVAGQIARQLRTFRPWQFSLMATMRATYWLEERVWTSKTPVAVWFEVLHVDILNLNPFEPKFATFWMAPKYVCASLAISIPREPLL